LPSIFAHELCTAVLVNQNLHVEAPQSDVWQRFSAKATFLFNAATCQINHQC